MSAKKSSIFAKRLDDLTADARRTNAGNRDKLQTAPLVFACKVA